MRRTSDKGYTLIIATPVSSSSFGFAAGGAAQALSFLTRQARTRTVALGPEQALLKEINLETDARSNIKAEHEKYATTSVLNRAFVSCVMT